MKEQKKLEWAKRVHSLVGRTIKNVRWISDVEQDFLQWDRSAVVIELDDGTLLIPQSDEGNYAGALSIQAGSHTRGIPRIAPVI